MKIIKSLSCCLLTMILIVNISTVNTVKAAAPEIPYNPRLIEIPRNPVDREYWLNKSPSITNQSNPSNFYAPNPLYEMATYAFLYYAMAWVVEPYSTFTISQLNNMGILSDEQCNAMFRENIFWSSSSDALLQPDNKGHINMYQNYLGIESITSDLILDIDDNTQLNYQSYVDWTKFFQIEMKLNKSFNPKYKPSYQNPQGFIELEVKPDTYPIYDEILEYINNDPIERIDKIVPKELEFNYLFTIRDYRDDSIYNTDYLDRNPLVDNKLKKPLLYLNDLSDSFEITVETEVINPHPWDLYKSSDDYPYSYYSAFEIQPWIDYNGFISYNGVDNNPTHVLKDNYNGRIFSNHELDRVDRRYEQIFKFELDHVKNTVTSTFAHSDNFPFNDQLHWKHPFSFPIKVDTDIYHGINPKLATRSNPFIIGVEFGQRVSPKGRFNTLPFDVITNVILNPLPNENLPDLKKLGIELKPNPDIKPDEPFIIELPVPYTVIREIKKKDDDGSPYILPDPVYPLPWIDPDDNPDPDLPIKIPDEVPIIIPDDNPDIIIIPSPVPDPNPDLSPLPVPDPDLDPHPDTNPDPDLDDLINPNPNPHPDPQPDPDPDPQPDPDPDLEIPPDMDKLKLRGILKDKFPFCIPFDLYRAISVLAVSPEPPVFIMPIKFKNSIMNIDEEIKIDLSSFELIARLSRWLSTLLFAYCLALGTRKLIMS